MITTVKYKLEPIEVHELIMDAINKDPRCHKINTLVPATNGYGSFYLEVEVTETNMNMVDTLAQGS